MPSGCGELMSYNSMISIGGQPKGVAEINAGKPIC